MSGSDVNNVGGGQSARQYSKQALLPEGLRDQLAPFAEQEAGIIRSLIDVFLSYGYDRVSPPLVEFEDSLLVGPTAYQSAKHGTQMFRLLDPETQKVMALRTDMTVQISRIAATRLQSVERPLRLAYAGNVMRVKGSQIRPTRQFYQAGVELIGATSLEADLEVISLAVNSLKGLGISDLSLDLTVAPLVSAICGQLGLGEMQTEAAREALDTKDVGALAGFDDSSRALLTALLNAAGPADYALANLHSLKLDGEALRLIEGLASLSAMISTQMPDLAVTIDPGESHGFEYKTGIGFALFARGVRGELGRGGRYETSHADGSFEPSTGFSVYLDTLLRALPAPSPVDKLFVAHGVSSEQANNLRKEGWRVIQGLTDAADSLNEASRLGCSHYFDGTAVKTL